METTVKQRLMEFMKYKGISQGKFEKAVGLSNGYINSLRHAPSATKLQSILGTYPELNSVWLLSGEGEMLNVTAQVMNPSEARVVSENGYGVKFMESKAGMLINVPIVPYAALGSPLDEFAQLIEENGLEHTSFPVDGKHHGNYFAFRVEGDSMDDGSRDGFQPGDIVLVRELNKEDWAPKLHYSQWPFWVIVWGNCVRLKQIIGQNEEGTSIICHSLNPSPEYTDFTLNLNDVNRLFSVVQVRPKPRVY